MQPKLQSFITSSWINRFCLSQKVILWGEPKFDQAISTTWKKKVSIVSQKYPWTTMINLYGNLDITWLWEPGLKSFYSEAWALLYCLTHGPYLHPIFKNVYWTALFILWNAPYILTNWKKHMQVLYAARSIYIALREESCSYWIPRMH
jgi:hypothetical protein